MQYEGRYFHLKEGDKIWWLRIEDNVGTFVFSFDKKKQYVMFTDYPYKLSPEEKALFDSETPFWADFFKSRKYPY